VSTVLDSEDLEIFSKAPTFASSLPGKEVKRMDLRIRLAVGQRVFEEYRRGSGKRRSRSLIRLYLLLHTEHPLNL
jgi:hypothetical protein